MSGRKELQAREQKEGAGDGSAWLSMKERAADQRKERKGAERDGQEMLVLGWV